MLAYSTVYGKNISEEADFDFIKGEGEVLKDVVAPWFGTFFWIFGSISLVLVALGVVDYVARLVRRRAQDPAPARQRALERVEDLHGDRVDDVPRRLRGPAVAASTSRSCCSCCRACLNGIVMFIYSILLIKLNRKGLPPAIRVRGFRLGALVLRGAVLRLLRRLVRDRADRRSWSDPGREAGDRLTEAVECMCGCLKMEAGDHRRREGRAAPRRRFGALKRPRSYVSPVRLAGITMTLTAVGSSRPARSAASASSRP